MRLRTEDERKFLVRRMPANFLEKGGVEITQWYISFDPPVRVRVEDFEDRYLTIKIKERPGVNHELEDCISRRAATILTKARKGNKIRKTRYVVGNLELDVFHGKLSGLIMLELENKLKKGVLRIPLGFVAEEVTGDERFENHNLVKMESVPPEWRCRIV